MPYAIDHFVYNSVDYSIVTLIKVAHVKIMTNDVQSKL